MKKQSKLEKFTPIILGTCMLTFVAACGSSDDDDSSGGSQQEQTQEGLYRAVLGPVNTGIAPDINGVVDISNLNDDFEVDAKVSGAPSGIHFQFIYTGGSCPGADADVDGNTVVDIVEATSAIGSPLIPLDANLDSQAAGFPVFPSGASYNYGEDTSFATMMEDLRSPDTIPSDSLVKLEENEELNLEGKVVVVHGVSFSQDLPDDVASVDNLPATTTVPIACGIIEKIGDGGTTGGTTGGETTGGTTGGETTGGTTGGETTGGTTGGETTGGTTGGETTGGTTGGETTGGATGGTPAP